LALGNFTAATGNAVHAGISASDSIARPRGGAGVVGRVGEGAGVSWRTKAKAQEKT
jgi:hypothetical protein